MIFINETLVPKVVGHTTTSPADLTTYCYGATQGNTMQATVNGGGAIFKFVRSKTITQIVMDLRIGTVGSNEVVNIYLRNCNDSTEQLIGTIDYSLVDFVGASAQTKIFSVNIPVLNTKSYTIKEVIPNMITNPINVAKTFHLF